MVTLAGVPETWVNFLLRKGITEHNVKRLKHPGFVIDCTEMNIGQLYIDGLCYTWLIHKASD